MTEYELGEILHSNYAGLWQGAQMYFTLVSAYLVVAYLVGAKLSSGQNAVVTALYIVWVAGVTQWQYTTSTQTLGIIDELLSIESVILPSPAESEVQVVLYGFLVVQVLGILASLWFMWKVRHPKK
jgi:hypothetical protein